MTDVISVRRPKNKMHGVLTSGIRSGTYTLGLSYPIDSGGEPDVHVK